MERPNEGSFYRELRAKSKDLDCYFDKRMQKWVVTCARPYRDPIIIHVVHDENGEYKYPDKRELELIFAHDKHRISLEEQIQQKAYILENIREEHKKKVHEDIRDRTKDDVHQLMAAFNKQSGERPGYTPFRRITPKEKGYTVNDKRKLRDTNSK